MKVVGRWKDRIRQVNGPWEEGQEGQFEWDFNQIQNSFASLLASWCRAEAGYDRIGFMGIGSGAAGWDSVPPTQLYSQTILTAEYFRKAISQVSIVFIDPITNISTGGVPSSKIELTVLLASGEANGTLREFGLFGGTATVSLDSGEMVNWVVHSRIDKDSSIEIERKVRIEFVTQ